MLKCAQYKVKITAEGRFFPAIMPNGNYCEEIADDQYFSMMILDVDGEKLVLSSFDAIGMSEGFSDRVRNTIGEIVGIPTSHINVGFTHSHCAPDLGRDRGAMAKADPGYLDFVVAKVGDCTKRCLKQGLKEVEVYERVVDGGQYYSNRNGLDKVGDTEIKLLEFRDHDGEVKGLLLCYACHGTIVNFQNSRALTSDIGGYLCRGIEEKLGVYPVAMMGAAGDMGNRCLRQGNTYEELIRVGDGLLSTIFAETI